MNKGSVEIRGKIPLPRDVLWKFLMETPDWHPGTREVKIEGDLRSFSRDEGSFVERFTVKEYEYRYTFLESPYPLVDYQACFQLNALGASDCEVVWSSTFLSPLPKEESEKLVSDVYKGAIRFLQEKFAGCLLRRVEAQELESKQFGFYWEELSQLIEQIESECREVEEAYESGNREHLQEELGDMIQAAISLAVFCRLDPHETLLKSINKYQKRFDAVVKLAQADGHENLQGQPFSVLLKYWKQAKLIGARG